MKIICYMVILLYFICKVTSSKSPNVGTVLFTASDLIKKCWSDNDRSLLVARQIMQDIIPEPQSIHFNDPQFITVLIEYFQSCFEVISRSTNGKNQHLMFLALSDTIGGYLKSSILPITKRAYYSGQLKYSEARELFQLYDDIRSFLKTNGKGWAKPKEAKSNCVFTVKPLKISAAGGEAACSTLILPTPCPDSSDHESTKITNNLQVLPQAKDYAKTKANLLESIKQKFQKKSAAEENHLIADKSFDQSKSKVAVRSKRELDQAGFHNSQSGNGGDIIHSSVISSWNPPNQLWDDEPETRRIVERSCQPGVKIPLPLLDSHKAPHSIALPFKSHPLRSLDAKSAIFILEKYYVTAVKCIASKSTSREDVVHFNKALNSWLVKEVFPHLADEKWYPAFGGVLRITESIKKFGSNTSETDFGSPEQPVLFDKGVEIGGSFQAKPESIAMIDSGSSEESTRYFIMYLASAVLLCLLIVCLCCYFCWRYKKRKGDTSNKLNVQFVVRFFKKLGGPPSTKSPQSQETRLSADKTAKPIISSPVDTKPAQKPDSVKLENETKNSRRSSSATKRRMSGKSDSNRKVDAFWIQTECNECRSRYPKAAAEEENVHRKEQVVMPVKTIWENLSFEKVEKEPTIIQQEVPRREKLSSVESTPSRRSKRLSEHSLHDSECSSLEDQVDVCQLDEDENSEDFECKISCPFSLENTCASSCSVVENQLSSTAQELFERIVGSQNSFNETPESLFIQESDTGSTEERCSSTSGSDSSSTPQGLHPIQLIQK